MPPEGYLRADDYPEPSLLFASRPVATVSTHCSGMEGRLVAAIHSEADLWSVLSLWVPSSTGSQTGHDGVH